MNVRPLRVVAVVCVLLVVGIAACSGSSPAQPLLNAGLVLEDDGDLEGAIASYTEAIERDGRYIPAYRQRAAAYIDLGRPDLAVEDYTQILSIDDEDSLAMAGRGRAYTAAGMLDLAIADLDMAIDEDRLNAEAYFNRAVALRAGGNDNRAIVDLKEYNELIPDDPDAHFLLAESYRAISQIDLAPRPETACRRGTACRSAVSAFDKVIELDPEYPDVYLKRGVAHRNNGSVSLALKDLEMAIEIDVGNVEVYLERGRTYLENEQPVEGLADLRQAISLVPEEPLAYYSRGWAYLDLGRPLPAIRDFFEAIKLVPQNTGAYTSRGIAYMAAGWYRKALAEFDASLGIVPDDPEVMVLRGESHYRLGDLQEAIEDFSAALAIDPDLQAFYDREKRGEVDLQAYYLRAWSYVELGDLEKASEDFDAARDADVDGTEDPVNTGLVYRNLGLLGVLLPPPPGCDNGFDCNAILRQAFEELESNPSSTEAHVDVGHVLYRLDLRDIAEERFEAAIDLEPFNLTTRLAIGRVYLAGGEYGKAVRNLELLAGGRGDDAESQLVFGMANRWLGQWRQDGVWLAVCRRGPACANASRALNRAVDLAPDEPEAYIQRAAVLRNQGRPDLAVFDLDTAIELGATDAWSFVERGNLYMELGIYERAVQDFDEAVRLDRELGPAFGYRTLAQVMLGADFAADRDALRAVSLGVDEALLTSMIETLKEERNGG